MNDIHTLRIRGGPDVLRAILELTLLVAVVLTVL
jgi:hypothetical protein